MNPMFPSPKPLTQTPAPVAPPSPVRVPFSSKPSGSSDPFAAKTLAAKPNRVALAETLAQTKAATLANPEDKAAKAAYDAALKAIVAVDTAV